MKKNIIFILTIIAFLIVGNPAAKAQPAGSPWPGFHGDSKLTGQSQYDTSKISGAIKWRVDATAGIETSPVIAADGTIYIADHTCALYAINPDGKEKWKFDAGDPVSSIEWGGFSCFQASPSLSPDGTIYIAPMSGYLFAISPDGQEKWRYPVFNFKNNWSSPAVGPDGTIYVGSEAYPPSETGQPQKEPAYIYAINPSGTLKWEYNTGGNWSTSTASIADDGTVYMSGNDCKKSNCENVLFSFNGQTGELKWVFNHGGVMESSASIARDGTIYFGVKGKTNPRQGAKFYAVTPEGKEKWNLEVPCGNSIVPGIANDGTIYFGDWDGAFYALTPEGKIIWKVKTRKTFETLSSSPAIGADGTIYFGSLANYFYAYTPDGQEKWKFRVENGINSSPAIGKDGTVYVGLTDGELIAFGEGEPTAEDNTITIGADTNDTSPDNRIIAGLIIFFFLATFGMVIYFKTRNVSRRVWLFLTVPALAVIVLSLMMAFPKRDPKSIYEYRKDQPSKDNTLDSMFKFGEDFEKICPDKVTVDYNEYTAVTEEKTWKVPNMRQLDWISEKCPNTVWPDGKARIYEER